MDDAESMQERFQACMVLAGVGDTLGYYNGAWEFNPSGVTIHCEADRMGGVERIRLDRRKWMVSDDTVMHIATAEALVAGHGQDHETLLHMIAEKYIQCMSDMHGRAPGLTCSSSVHMLAPFKPQGYQIPFNPRGGGCGAAMRAAPIGLCYWRPEQIDSLVEVAIESGRMTHNHPTGYLGSLATALFVSYAVQKKPLREWGAGLMKTLQMAKEYVTSSGRDLEANLRNWSYFETQWRNYLQRRKIEDGVSQPHADYNVSSVKARDAFYEELSFDGTGGASGHDAPMIAYEALLFTWKPTDPSNQEEKRRQWMDLCKCSMLHGGDSDSTGIIAGACWGAMEGYLGVPKNHYKEMEYRARLEALGKDLFQKATDGYKEQEKGTSVDQPATDNAVVVSEEGMKDAEEEHCSETDEDL